MKWVCVLSLFVALAVAENPEENAGIDDPDLFEGDMRLTAEQRLAAEMGLDVDKPLGRGSIRNRKWPGGVMVYVIDSSLSGSSRAMSAIRGGMQEWTSKTCIRFKERTNEAAYANFKLGGGCSSYVGRTGGKQDINLASGCWSKGIVAHEIGHALGFFHEQSRPDRDNYVTIKWENIKTGRENNFKKYSKSTIDSLGTDYDYRSVMHYRATSFSKNGQPTIVVKKSGETIGQRKGLSTIDAQQGNLLYKGECGGGGGGGPETLPPTARPTTRPTTPGGGGGGGGSNCKDTFLWCRVYDCHHKEWAKKNCPKTCNMC
ncbi:zinc metalloproteinase nas-15-like [Oculina patagonica]